MTPSAGRPDRRQELAIAPVRAALLRSSRAQAEQIRAAATRAADVLIGQARIDAAGRIRQARDEGRSQAAPLALAELSRARQQARAITLQAGRRFQAELEGRITAAITGMKDEPDYGELRDRLAELALRTAGPGAVISEHPQGGVVARAPGVLVDCSLPRLAQRVIGALAARIRDVDEHD